MPDSRPSSTPENTTPPPGGAPSSAPSTEHDPAVYEPLRSVYETVAEIRERLADISERELELRRREQACAKRYRQLEQVADRVAASGMAANDAQLQQDEARLAEREAQVEQDRDALRARQALLDEEAQRLQTEWGELGSERKALEERATAIEARLAEQRARHQRQRTALRKRVAALRARAHELVRRSVLAREELNGKRQATAEREAVFTRRAERLDALEQELERRQDAIRQRTRVLDEQDAQLTQRATDQTLARNKLERERREWQRANEDLARQQAALQARQEEYDAYWQARHDEQQDLTRELDELDARRRLLVAHDTELQQREMGLDHRTAQLEQRIAALHDGRNALRALRDDLEARAANLEEHQAMLDTHTREADTRVAASAATAAAAEQRLAELSTELEQLRRMKPAPAHRRPSGRRVLGLAVLTGCVTAAVWWGLHPPRYVATTQLQVAASGPEAALELTRHRLALSDPNLEAIEDLPATARAAWQAATLHNEVQIVPDATTGVLHLACAGNAAADTQRLLDEVTRRYAAATRAADSVAALPPELAELLRWRRELEADTAAAQSQRQALVTELATLPDPNAAATLSAELTQLSTTLATAITDLDGARATLATLLATDAPPGEVSATDIEAAQAADTIYTEDTKAFQAAALSYRSELAISMLQLVDPARMLVDALDKLHGVYAEQLELDPPVAIRTLLEDSLRDLEAVQERAGQFRAEWEPEIAVVQSLSVEDDAVELVTQQVAAADRARALGDLATKLVDDLGTQIEALGSTDESTRAVVVTAMLRGELTALKKVVEDFLPATRQPSVTENIELDALDRQLRGLRMRLDARAESIQQRLQQAADEASRTAYAARVDAARAVVQQLERQREQLLADIAALVGKRQALDDALAQRAELTAQRARWDAELNWLQTRNIALGQTLETLRRAATRGPVEATAVDVRPASARAPGVDAGLAGGVGFAVAGLIGLLTLVRRPGPGA